MDGNLGLLDGWNGSTHEHLLRGPCYRSAHRVWSRPSHIGALSVEQVRQQCGRWKASALARTQLTARRRSVVLTTPPMAWRCRDGRPGSHGDGGGSVVFPHPLGETIVKRSLFGVAVRVPIAMAHVLSHLLPSRPIAQESRDVQPG